MRLFLCFENENKICTTSQGAFQNVRSDHTSYIFLNAARGQLCTSSEAVLWQIMLMCSPFHPKHGISFEIDPQLFISAY